MVVPEHVADSIPDAVADISYALFTKPTVTQVKSGFPGYCVMKQWLYVL